MGSELLTDILDALGSRVVQRKASGEIVVWCPFHPDGQGNPPHSPNLVIKPGNKGAAYVWACPVCNEGGTLLQLADRLRETGIMPPRDGQKPSSRIVAKYDYRDEEGRLLYQVCRWADKAFPQRRKGHNGKWIWGLGDTRRVPYRLPELLAADPGEWVLIPEGEKDADNLARLGLVATTNSGGAGKWRDELSLHLKGRKVAILPDNDDPGRRHAQQVAESLATYASLVKVVELPGLPPGGDVSDWLDAGHTAEELLALTEATPNFTSNYKEGALEVRLVREINAAKLQEEAQEGPDDLPFLPLLGQDGFIVSGWSHILASSPKVGKTELVTSLCHEWGASGATILYFTEEPESIWRARLRQRPPGWEHVTLVLALGMKPSEIRERIEAGRETVVVLDTVRNLLALRDETDNSEIALVLIPFIAAARQGDKTAVFLHHIRKGGGEHGEGITGGHAFLGVVDVALELRRDPQVQRRRHVRGWGRIIPVPELVYEMAEDDTFMALGEPGVVALEVVKERMDQALTEEWATTKELHEQLEAPQPSLEQARLALQSLAHEGRAERNPPISEGQQRGKTYRWRRGNLTSNGPAYRLEVRLPDGSGAQGARDAKATEAAAISDDGCRKVARDLWEDLGYPPVPFKSAETITDLDKWLSRASDEDVAVVVRTLEAMAARKAQGGG